jgi:hypothetical protein
MPDLSLDVGDAAEFAGIPQFPCDCLAAGRGGPGVSLQRFAGRPACGITQRRAGLDRFTSLLGGSDGGPLPGLCQGNLLLPFLR